MYVDSQPCTLLLFLCNCKQIAPICCSQPNTSIHAVYTFLCLWYVDSQRRRLYFSTNVCGPNTQCPSLHNNACNSQPCKLYFCSLCISMQTFNLFPHVQCTSYIAMVYALYVRRSFVQTFLFTFITFKKNTYIISHNLCSASFQQPLFHDIFPNSFPTPGAAFFKAFLVYLSAS